MSIPISHSMPLELQHNTADGRKKRKAQIRRETVRKICVARAADMAAALQGAWHASVERRLKLTYKRNEIKRLEAIVGLLYPSGGVAKPEAGLVKSKSGNERQIVDPVRKQITKTLAMVKGKFNDLHLAEVELEHLEGTRAYLLIQKLLPAHDGVIRKQLPDLIQRFIEDINEYAEQWSGTVERFCTFLDSELNEKIVDADRKLPTVRK